MNNGYTFRGGEGGGRGGQLFKLCFNPLSEKESALKGISMRPKEKGSEYFPLRGNPFLEGDWFAGKHIGL